MSSDLAWGHSGGYPVDRPHEEKAKGFQALASEKTEASANSYVNALPWRLLLQPLQGFAFMLKPTTFYCIIIPEQIKAQYFIRLDRYIIEHIKRISKAIQRFQQGGDIRFCRFVYKNTFYIQ